MDKSRFGEDKKDCGQKRIETVDDELERTHEEPSPHNPENGHETQTAASTQDIFDARTALFMDAFVEVCRKEGSPIAVAIVVDPKIHEGPLVYTHGRRYDVALVVAKLLRQLKGQIAQDLDA